MKKILLNISSLLTAIITISMFIACSSDDNLDNKRSEDSKQQLTFTLTDEDFNADEDVSVTRAGKQSLEVAKDTIDLGNDIFAEATLECDTARDAKPATRAAGMSNGTYTILAYQSGVLKGTLKGTVTSNVFTATSANQSLNLDPGTYTFYCCNDKVNISGNNLTVNRADAGTARIGVTTKTIPATPTKQKVDFVMKHVGARVRIKVSGYMRFYSAAGFKTKNNIPGSTTLNATTGSYTTDNSVAANTSLSAGALFYNAYSKGTGNTFDALGDYYYILPGTDLMDLMVNFSTLKIYKKEMSNISLNGGFLLSSTTTQNGSYTLRIMLKYRYKLLYQDGTVWKYGDPVSIGHGHPIAVVINDNNGTPQSGTAMALEDCGYNATYPESEMPSSYSITASNTLEDAGQDKNGYSKTWNEFSSGRAVVDAARYGQGGSYRQPFASATNVSKWYLPAAGEWVDACEKLFFGSKALGISHNEWAADCYPDAIETVTGGPMSQWYWTASTVDWSWVGFGINGSNSSPAFYAHMETTSGLSYHTIPTALSVRSFIHF
jgi:hypothetical protein